MKMTVQSRRNAIRISTSLKCLNRTLRYLDAIACLIREKEENLKKKLWFPLLEYARKQNYEKSCQFYSFSTPLIIDLFNLEFSCLYVFHQFHVRQSEQLEQLAI